MEQTKTYILGIESSCDDTSAAVSLNTQILSNVIATQKIHEQYGGIVPELASRAHLKNIIPVVTEALKQAGISLQDLDAIAFTKGPGLLGSLIVGTSFAKALSLSLNKPLIDVHHMKAHVMALFIDNEANRKPNFPFLCLTVSGGHTQIVKVSSFQKMKVIGSTIDDAAGEAFDKCGKIMGLVYPGGPLIDKMAQIGDPKRFQFSKPKVDGLNFSFSGLKTHAVTIWNQSAKDDRSRLEIAKAFQQSVIDTLIIKCKRSLLQTACTRLVVAGGVGANKALRFALQEWIKGINGQVYFPVPEYCTDNGAMVAYAGCLRMMRGEKDLGAGVEVKARWPLASTPN